VNINVMVVTRLKPVSMEMTVEKLIATGRCIADVTQALKEITHVQQRISSFLWMYDLPNFNFLWFFSLSICCS
jgi:hypothetical protein